MVSADALIAVTPIFSTSYSGLFKSFIDVLDPDALTGKPVLIGANAGTARHSLAIDYAIRPLFAYLHAEAVSTGVFAASSDWGGAGDDVAPLAKRVEKGAKELAEAIARRGASETVDPYDLPRTWVKGARSATCSAVWRASESRMTPSTMSEGCRTVASCQRTPPSSRSRTD